MGPLPVRCAASAGKARAGGLGWLLNPVQRYDIFIAVYEWWGRFFELGVFRVRSEELGVFGV